MNPNPRRKGGFLGFIRSLLLFVLLIGIIVSSFWVSFLLGKRILVPVKKIPERRFEVVAPESRPTPAALQRLEEVMLEEEEKIAVEEVEAAQAEPAKVAEPKPAEGKPSSGTKHYFKVQAGVFSSKSNALALERKLNASGFATYTKKVTNGWRVQVGAFYKKSHAQHLQSSLSAKGFESTIIYE